MDFITALKQHLEADPKLSKRGQRILEVVNARPSQRRTRRLDRLERLARVHLGMDSFSGDWATALDWSTIILDLIRFILAILPFILAL